MTTTTVTRIDGAGAARCDWCRGRCDYTWLVTYSDGTKKYACSTHVPPVGSVLVHDHVGAVDDLVTRWRPTDEQLTAARALVPGTWSTALVALAMPGKDRGVWVAGQAVEAVPGVWPGEHREEALRAAEAHLAGRAGTVAYVRVYADGMWAVFEESPLGQ